MSRKTGRNNFSDNGFEMWGGYMNAKIAKLEEQFLEQASKEIPNVSGIFSGISIFVNGYTTPTANELKMIMAEHGGIYHHYFRSSGTKFIIASNLPDTKVKNLPTTKIVKPEWIADSLKAGVLLDYKDYLLYSNLSKTQPCLKFGNSTAVSKSEESIENDLEIDDISSVDLQNEKDVECSKDENARLPLVAISNTTPNQQNTKSKSIPTATDPTFLSEFYNNSRLHHISQLGAGFKQYINELRAKSDFNFPLRDSIRKTDLVENSTFVTDDSSMNKTIMHIDMDCFFVSVGLRRHPQLRGKPVAVTHSKGGGVARPKRDGVNRQTEFNLYKERKKNKLKKATGELDDIAIKTRVDSLADEEDGNFSSMSEIASCSYEARALGIHNGMFMGSALRLCPELKTIPYDFEAYKEVAFLLYNTVAEYTLDIEAVSCDEMYVDCTDLLRDTGITAMEFATHLRRQIKQSTGCPCSTGFGGNKLQARMATKKAKPDGQYYLLEDNVECYFSSIQLGDLPGVGHQMESKLLALGYKDCASLRNATLTSLQKHFGNKTGHLLYNCSRGVDDKPLHYTTVRKSISAGVNYGIRFEEDSQAETFLRQLCQEVCSRMSQNNVVGKSITLKLMVRSPDAPVETAKFMGHGFCDNITKTSNLPHCTDDVELIFSKVIDLFKKINSTVEDMRGISIQISKLENSSEKNNKKGGIECFLKQKIPNSKETSCQTQSTNDTPSIRIDTKCEISTKDQETKTAAVAVNSTEKRQVSPLKRNKSLGLTSRRRGRPPKHLSNTNNSMKVEKIKSINLFLNNVPKNTTSRELNSQGSVDEDFLNALPDDIKSEVLANYKIKVKQCNNGSTSDVTNASKLPETSKRTSNDETYRPALKIDPDCLNALPEDLRKEIEANIEIYGELMSTVNHRKNEDKEIKENKMEGDYENIENEVNNESDDNIMELDWRDMRSMMRSWFASTDDPLQCDVDLITSYLQKFVYRKNIEDLYCLMNFLYRILSTDYSCNWHKAYIEMENNVQNAMLEIYENKLHTNTAFSCCNKK